jgi:hypothetical protein
MTQTKFGIEILHVLINATNYIQQQQQQQQQSLFVPSTLV